MERLNLILVNGQATFFTREGVVKTSDEWTTLDGKAIKQVIQRMGFRGKSVCVFYEGEYISHHDIDVPEMDAEHTLAFIQHRLGKTIQCVDPAGLIGFLRSADRNNVLFDVIDRVFYKSIQKAFSENGIAVDMVCALTPALQRIASSIKHDAPILVQYAEAAAHMNFMLYYNVEKKAPALFRSSPLAASEEHLRHDLSRSLQLGKQLFGGREPDVFLISEHAPAINDITYLGGEEFLQQAILGMSIQTTANFVPVSQRSIHAQNLRMLFAYAMICLFVASTCASYFYLNHQIHNRNMALLQIKQLVSEKERYITKISTYQKMEKFDHWILDTQGDTPVLLLANLGNDLGYEFTLKEFTASDPHNGSVTFSIEGEVFTDPVHAPDALRALESHLQEEPYRAEIKHSWKEFWLKGIELWSNARGVGGQHKGIPFVIGGIIHE